MGFVLISSIACKKLSRFLPKEFRKGYKKFLLFSTSLKYSINLVPLGRKTLHLRENFDKLKKLEVQVTGKKENNCMKSFQEVVDFHRHLCLDIAMGYRIAQAAMREMANEVSNMKQVVAMVENETCAIDAIQEFTGCTMGKRNLILTGVGKPVYILMNTKTRNAVRIYCHFWETFDPDGSFSKRRRHAASSLATKEEAEAFQKELKSKIDEIMTSPEDSLFSTKKITMDPPPKSGKYQAEACQNCGEYTHVGRFQIFEGKKICKDCTDSLTVKPT